MAVIEKAGDKYEVGAKVETPKSARTAPLAADGDRLVVAVLVQGGVGGLEVRVFAVRPPTPKS